MTPRLSLAQTHPQIVSRMVDPDLAQRYGAGSAKVVLWVCPKHPNVPFDQPIRRVVKGSGCPYCSGHRVLAGFNDLATTHPEIADELVDQPLANTLSAGSNTVQTWGCEQGHRWEAMVSNRTKHKHRTGCPYCSGRQVVAGQNDLATIHPELSKELLDPTCAIGLAPRSHTSLTWCCPTCGHLYQATAANRTAKRPRGCPVCANRVVVPGVNDLATTHPDLTKRLVEPDEARTVVFGTGRILQWRCPEHPQIPIQARPMTLARSGCGICNGKVVVPGLNDLATTHPDLAAQLVDPSLATTLIAGSGTRVDWQCPRQPDHTWTTFLYGRTGVRKGTGCPHCFSTQPSTGENELAAAIQALVPTSTMIRSDRTVLDRGELDILLPEHRLAVEFNGVYWHSEEAGTGRLDHQRKTEAARAAGLRLIQVWEDDWRSRPEVVLRGIAHRLGATGELLSALPGADPRIAQRRFARTLVPGQASQSETREFLDTNHLQGQVLCDRVFVLREEDGTIRALLGLRSPRSNVRTRRAKGQWEIQRYATLGSVPGGFSRLLSHAERQLQDEGVQLDSWVTFAAGDVSEGALYEHTGFIADKVLPPNYTYVGRLTAERRVPKESFQRKRFRGDPALFWDESWTEQRAARENGLRRIWDCGKVRWVRPVL